MPAYLTAAEFKLLTPMPASDVDALESAAPGWLAAQLEQSSADIDARLRKRYAVPFGSPAPHAVRGWLARIVTRRAYLRRGVDPTDPQFAEIVKDAEQAVLEIAEAANGETGLFDLPLRADTTATGITKGGPLGYSEQSPYVAFDRQGEIGRSEDAAGRGTSGG
jgi:phage gp36-like protein